MSRRFVLKSRSWLTVTAFVDGIGIVFGASQDGTLTDSRNNALDLDVVNALIAGDVRCTTVHRYSSDQRARYIVGKANYGSVAGFRGQTWTLQALILRHPNADVQDRNAMLENILARYAAN